MSSVATALPLGKAIELNFVIHKFDQLPLPIKRIIYEILRADEDRDLTALVSIALIDLLMSNGDELTAFANTELDLNLFGWLVPPEEDNLLLHGIFLADYFRENLRLEGVIPQLILIDPVKIERRATL